MAPNKSPSPKKRLKDRAKVGLAPHDVKKFLLELTSGSDRSAALVASSYLDAEIADYLEAYLNFQKKEEIQNLLRGPNAPLSTFSSRIKILFALGLIDEGVRNDLETIRGIRNEFAHSYVPLYFSTPEVQELCQTLPPNDKHTWPEGTSMSNERRRFVGTCVTISYLLAKQLRGRDGRPPEKPST